MTLQWVKIFATAIEPYTLILSIVIMILLWLLFFIRYHLCLILPISKELERFSLYLSRLSNSEERNEYLVSKYMSNLSDKSVLSSIWNDFLRGREAEPKQESYFSELYVIDIPAKKEGAASVPTFLLTMGLAASFLRLFFTFVVLPEGADLSAALYPAVSEVILIILFAILISYLFAIFNRSFFGKAKTSLYEIRKL
ncbi:MAG: hypothetical protein PHP79_09925, partial [Clostridia bacterium]|nr:hypothetical protein [Clostridia bacterium]